MSKHVAIIPARNGSKSIQNKNLIRIKNKTIVAMAVDSALESGVFSKVYLTTDIPFLVDEYEDSPNVSVIRRDPKLCSDTADMTSVVLDVIYKECIPEDFVVWLLQPTSPFRNKHDYHAIVSKIRSDKSVISVCDTGPNHPDRMGFIKNGLFLQGQMASFKNKQDLNRAFIRNGAYYVIRAGDLIKAKSFYVQPCAAYVMERARSINIDGPEDYFLARAYSEGHLP